jgi:3-oxoacyl-[acyl-carrier protein] reductase
MNHKPVALITGGSRGIGRAIALELARGGYDLAISFSSHEAAAEAARAEVEQAGAACLVVQSNVSLAADRARLLEAIEQRFGRCDLLVNNAGVAPTERADLLEATEASFERVMRVNLQGPYFLTQAVARWMVHQRGQDAARPLRIVSIASISSYASSPTRGEYCVSKAGLSMMTALFADRLGEHRIGVFEVRPGIIATDMTAPVKEKYDRLIAEGLTPQRRWGRPEDVARAIGAIAAGSLDFSTGAVIDVDGGFHLRRL